MSIISRLSQLFERSRRTNTTNRSRSHRSIINRTRRSLGFRSIYSTSQVQDMTIKQLIEIPPDEFKFNKIRINQLDTDKKTLLTIMRDLKREHAHLTPTEIDAKYQPALQKALEDELGLNSSYNPLVKAKQNATKSIANLQRIQNAISRSRKSVRNTQSIAKEHLKKREELKKRQSIRSSRSAHASRSSRSSNRYINP